MRFSSNGPLLGVRTQLILIVLYQCRRTPSCTYGACFRLCRSKWQRPCGINCSCSQSRLHATSGCLSKLQQKVSWRSFLHLGLLDFTYFVIYRVLYHGSHWLSSLPVSLSCRNPQGKTQWHWCGLLLPVDRKHGDAGRGNALNL
jgi:hypothetical protein